MRLEPDVLHLSWRVVFAADLGLVLTAAEKRSVPLLLVGLANSGIDAGERLA